MGVPRLALLAVLAVSSCAYAGDVSGRIRITKPLTKKRVSLNSVYDRTSAIPVAAVHELTLQDELDHIVVYLENGPKPAKRVTANVNQIQRRFDPDVVAIPAGSTVNFPNSDPIFHNIFSLSRAKLFDLGNYPKGQSRTVTFNEPGIILVHCHLHSNMSAAIVVTPTEWLARPDKEGRYELKGLPTGKHTIIAWHKSAGIFRKQVEVKEGTTTLDIEVPIHDQMTERISKK